MRCMCVIVGERERQSACARASACYTRRPNRSSDADRHARTDTRHTFSHGLRSKFQPSESAVSYRFLLNDSLPFSCTARNTTQENKQTCRPTHTCKHSTHEQTKICSGHPRRNSARLDTSKDVRSDTGGHTCPHHSRVHPPRPWPQSWACGRSGHRCPAHTDRRDAWHDKVRRRAESKRERDRQCACVCVRE